jgi:hypothetical protein
VSACVRRDDIRFAKDNGEWKKDEAKPEKARRCREKAKDVNG